MIRNRDLAVFKRTKSADERRIAVNTMPMQIAERLRNLIASGGIAPGSRLGQVELAGQFGVSGVPLREALKNLAAEGMVVYDPQRGYFVGSLSSAEAQQLFRLREMVESEVMHILRWPDKPEIAALRDWVARLQRMIRRRDRFDWWISHREFMPHFLSLWPQDAFVAEARRLWDVTARYHCIVPRRLRPTGDGVIHSLHAMQDAVARCDRESLVRSRESRISETEVIILELLLERGL